MQLMRLFLTTDSHKVKKILSTNFFSFGGFVRSQRMAAVPKRL